MGGRYRGVREYSLGIGSIQYSLYYSTGCTVVYMTTVETRLSALARIGKALADPTRCRILLRLLDRPCYPAELAAQLGLTRANVSNHLTCLRGCGLVVAIPEGRRARYELADPRLRRALEDLAGVVLAVDESRRCLDERPMAHGPVALAAADPADRGRAVVAP
jgi:ArsR family transcriptional regulator, cadmium/lead-responsive transcriptional repressor